MLPGEPFEAVQGKVHGEIERYFKLVLNRPEILNRIGENIIVFDFIRADVAEQIFTQMVDGTFADLREQRLVIELAEAPRQALHDLCLGDLSNGGAASATSSKRACSTRCRGHCSTRTRSRASAS